MNTTLRTRPAPPSPASGTGAGAATGLCIAACALAVLLATTSTAAGGPALAGDPYADGVESYLPGTNGGFGADQLPDVVLGPPRGAGAVQGSTDVLALGIGGSIVLRFDPPVICDGPGADFTVFENAFHSGSENGPIFTEYGFIAVSQDGAHFFEMPYDPLTGMGLAGRTPVYSNPDNGISPLDPSVSGGDAFDLADVGLAWAAYVRVTDVGGAIRDVGDLPQFTVAPNAGFDLDAIAALHACDPDAVASATPTATPTPLDATPPPSPPTPQPTATVAPTPPEPTATATAATAGPTTTVTASSTERTASPTPTAIAGDLDGDGRVTALDLAWLTSEIYDGDGDATADAGGGTVASTAAADVNRDSRITAADVVALTARRGE